MIPRNPTGWISLILIPGAFITGVVLHQKAEQERALSKEMDPSVPLDPARKAELLRQREEILKKLHEYKREN
ncbi:8578_t:CDS:2 [Paraglomus occultum]|uniref:8578_t:CDS:1 n=1 Tax=Paraglomus occultum TaxID=144539 RepID=A0A9N8W355_9GLOM|nr:8578_t:CDS:2 [Paraglomus occultum]